MDILNAISFDHFIIEVKEDISPQHIAMINPNVMKFFKIRNIYLALSVDRNKLVVNFAINTGKRNMPDWPRVLEKECIRLGAEAIRFYTSVNNKMVQAIAERYDCGLVETIPNFYSDGEDALIYEYKIV